MQQITLTAQEAERAKDLNVAWMQKWLNVHGACPVLEVDGVGGSLTRAAIIQVFVNKQALPIYESQLQTIAEELGDTTTKRIKAVAVVESGPYGFRLAGYFVRTPQVLGMGTR